MLAILKAGVGLPIFCGLLYIYCEPHRPPLAELICAAGPTEGSLPRPCLRIRSRASKAGILCCDTCYMRACALPEPHGSP